MSKSVDERVVRMEFDNKQFEKGVAESTATLDKLEKTIQGLGKNTSALDKLERSLADIGSSQIQSNITRLANRLTTIPGKIVSDIQDKVISVGKSVLNLVNPLNYAAKAIDQAISGGKNRAQNIENAKFQLKGLGVAWNEIEDDINYGVKDTAYGLDAAAKAASQLVASQVQLGDEMKQALRGISGVAAMTNSSYEEISRIFTQVAGNGRLMGNDLTQLASRGLNVAATLGQAMGKTEAEIRDMVSKGKIDFKTFSEAMDNAFGEHAKEANKTFSGALSNMKAALSRLGASFAGDWMEDLRTIFIDLIPLINQFHNELKPTIAIINRLVKEVTQFANMVLESQGIQSVIHDLTRSIDRFVKKILSYKQQITTGFKFIGYALKNLVKAFTTALSPIVKALGNLSKRNFTAFAELAYYIEQFTEKLILSKDAVKMLTSIFETFNYLILFAWDGLKKVMYVLAPLGTLIRSTFGGVLKTVSLVAEKINKDIFKSLHDNGNVVSDTMLAARQAIQNFIDFLTNAMTGVPEALADVVSAFITLGEVIFGWVKQIVESNFGQSILGLFGGVNEGMQEVDKTAKKSIVATVIKAIATALKGLGDILKKIDVKGIFDTIQRGLDWIMDMLNNVVRLLSGGAFNSVGDLFSWIGDQLYAFAYGTDAAANGISNLNNEMGKTQGALVGFASFFGGIRDAFTAFVDKVVDTDGEVLTLGSSITTISGILKDIPGTLRSSGISALKTTIGDIGDLAGTISSTLYDSLGQPDPSSIIGLGLGIGGSKALLALSNFLKNIGAAAKSIADAPKNISGAFKAIGDGFKESMKANAKAAHIKSFAILIGTMAAALVGLAIVNSKYDLVKPAIILGLAIAELTACLILIGKASKAVDEKGIIALGGLAVALGAAAVFLSIAVDNLLSIDWANVGIGNIIGAVASMTVLLGAMSGIVILLSKFTSAGGIGIAGAIGIVISLAAMFGAMVGLIHIMKGLSESDIEAINNSLLAIVGLMAGIGLFIALISVAGKGIALMGLGVLSFFTALIPLIAAIAFLAALPYETYVDGMGRLIEVFALMSAVMFATRLAGANAAKAGVGIMAMSAALVLIALAFAIIQTTIQKALSGNIVTGLASIFGAIVTISVVLAAFAGLMFVSQYASEAAAKLAITFVAIGGAILLISGAMVILSTIPAEKFKPLQIMLAEMMGAFVLIEAASWLAKDVKPGPILAMVLGIVAIVGAVLVLAHYLESTNGDTTNLWKGLRIVLTGLAGIAVIMVAMSKFTYNVSPSAIIAFILGVVSVTASILVLKQFGGEPIELVKIAGALAIGLLGLAGTMWAVSKITGNVDWKGILGLAGAVAILSVSLSVLATVATNADQLLLSAVVISTMLVALTILSSFAKDNLKGAAGVAILAGSVLVLAGAFAVLASIDMDRLIPPLIALGAAIAALVVVAFVLGKIAGPVLMGAGVLVALGGSLLIVTAAIWLGVKAFESAINSIEGVGDAIYDLGQRAPSLIASVQAIFNGISYAFNSMMADLTDRFPLLKKLLGDGFRDAADNAKQNMEASMKTARTEEAAYQMQKRAIDGINKANKEVEVAAEKSSSGFIDTLSGKLGDIKHVGTSFISSKDGLLGGVTESFPEVIKAGDNGMIDFVGALDKNAEANASGHNTFAGFEAAVDPQQFANLGSMDGNAYMTAFNNALTIKSPSREMAKSGSYALQGFIKGNTLSDYSDVGAKSATSFLTGFRDRMGIHSPAKETRADGIHTAQGFGQGTRAGIVKYVTPSLNELTSTINNKIAKDLSNSSMKEEGKKVPQSVANGVGDKKETAKAEKAAEKTGKKVTKATEKNLNEKTGKEQAKKYIIGITKGLDENTYKAIQSANNMLNSVENVLSRLDAGQATFGYFVSHIQEYVGANEELKDSLQGSRWLLANFIHENYKATDSYKDHMKTIDAYRREIQLLSVDTKANADRIIECFDGIAEEAQQMAKDAGQAFDDMRKDMVSSMQDMLKIDSLNFDPGFDLWEGTTELMAQDIFHVGDAFKDLDIKTKKALTSSAKALDKFERKSLHPLTEDIAKLSNVTKKTFDNMHSSLSAFSKFSQKETKSIASGLNILANYNPDDYNKKWETGPKSIFEHIEDQLKKAEERVANFRKLQQRNVSKDALDAIREMGDGADEIVKQLLEASDADIQKFNEYYSRSTELAASDIESPTEALIRSFEETIEKAQKKEKDLATLATRGLSEEMIKELSELGDEGEKIIEGFVNASDEEFEHLKSLYSQQNEMKSEKTENALDAFVRGMREDLEKATKREENYHKAYMKGFSEEMLNEIVAMGEEGDELLDQLANHLSVMNPKVKEIQDLYNKKQSFKETEDPTTAIFRTLEEELKKLGDRAEKFARLEALNIDEGYLNELKDMGDEAEPILDAMLSWSGEQITKFNEQYKLKLSFAKEESESAVDAMLRTMEKAREDAAKRQERKDILKVYGGLTDEMISYIVGLGEQGDKILEELAAAAATENLERLNQFKEMYTSLEQAQKEYDDKVASEAPNKINEQIEKNIQKNDELRAQYDQLIAMGYSKEFVDSLKERGAEGDALIKGLLQGNEESIRKANAQMVEWAKRQTQTLKDSEQDQADDMEEFFTELDKMAQKGVNAQFLAHMAKLGPGALKQIKLLNSMTDPELKAFTDQWSGHMDKTYTIADNAIINLAAAGVTGADGFVAGLNSVPQKFAEAGVEANYLSLINGLGLAINPAAYAVGHLAVHNIAVGMNEAQHIAKDAGTGAGSAAKGGAAGGLAGGETLGMTLDNDIATGINKYTNLVDAAAVGVSSSAIKKIIDRNASKIDGTWKLGENASRGYGDGMASKGAVEYVEAQAEHVALRALRRMQVTQDSHSPSKVTMGFGNDFTDGYALGIAENEGNVLTTVDSMVKTASDALAEYEEFKNGTVVGEMICESIFAGLQKNSDLVMNQQVLMLETVFESGKSIAQKFIEVGLLICNRIMTGVTDRRNDVINLTNKMMLSTLDISSKTASKFVNIGNQMCNGLIQGLQNGRNAVVRAAESVAYAAYQAAMAALDINSPSKKFAELGAYSAEGLALGLRNGESTVEKAGDILATSALENMRSTIAQINATINNEIHDPVIRPTIDTSNIARFARQASGYFEGQQISARLEAQGTASGETGNTTVNYYQNNYSPKALRSVDIYRQTNNQLRNIKTALNRR